MRAWVIRATGGLDQLQQSDVLDPPALGPRQVRVAPRAAALNHLDLFVVRGLPHEYRFPHIDRKSTRLNSSHLVISYAVFCLKKKIHMISVLQINVCTT